MCSVNRTAAGIVAGMLLFASAVAGAEKPVQWRSDYDTARKEATAKALPLFLEFHTDDCYHCRRLEAGPLRDSAVSSILNERYIPLRVDANKSPRLAEALRIQSYPTMIIASADGKIITFLEGYQDAKPLADHLQRALAAQTPEWMIRDYNEAVKAVSAGDYARAIPLLKGVMADGKSRQVQTKAKAVLDELELQAAGRLVRVKQSQERGQYSEALDLLTDLMNRYAGTTSATDGARLLTSLAERPETKTNQRSRRAQDLLAQAREAYKAERIGTALELCEILETTYKDLPEGRQGAELAVEIHTNPEKLSLACQQLNERLASMYAALGETWIKKGDRDQAVAYYEKAVKTAPASTVARDAQAKLTGLLLKPPAIPTNFQKPDK